MVAAVPQSSIDACEQDRFLAMLPWIETLARRAARQLPPRLRAEFVADVVAKAWAAFARLVETDRGATAYATPLARFAIAHVRAGRYVGARQNSEDVMCPRAQRLRGLCVVQIEETDGRHAIWRDAVVEDYSTPPDEAAAFRIDFPAFLSLLPSRERRISEELAMGHTTQDVARKFGVSSGRISQLRRELQRAWDAFHGEHAESSAVSPASAA